MKSLVACLFLLALPLASSPAAEETPTPAPKSGLLHRMLHPFGSKAAGAATPEPAAVEKPGMLQRMLHPFGGGKDADGKGGGKLLVALKLEPLPLKLTDAKRLKVTLSLVNRGKKLAALEFPTSQRIEVLIKAESGKLVEQWSQDQAFTNEPTVVTINPNERAEYTVEVATRDLVAGQRYTVQGFFPNYDALKAQQTVVPEK